MSFSRRMLMSAALGTAGVAVASEVAATISPKPVPAPPPPGCHSKGVAVHTFYGRTADMERYVSQMAEHPLTSRVRVVVVESTQGARVHVYERADGGYAASQWSGESVGNMRADWDARILKSRGNSCAGADLKADLGNRGMQLASVGTLPDAGNANTLLPLLGNETGYLRVSVYDPCE